MKKTYFGLVITVLLLLCSECSGEEALSVQGIVEPFKDATLSATIPGRIDTIIHRESEFVKKGDAIIELEKEEEELEVKRRKLIAESKSEVTAAVARVETLALDYEGMRKLYEATQSVSFEDLKNKELEYALAQAELERLKVAEKREVLEYGIAREQLKERTIRAPFDGVIAEVMLEEGESCDEQEPLVRIVDTRTCRLVAYVEARAARRLKAEQEVTVRVDNGGSPVMVRGTVEFVSPVVDPASGLREVKIVFDNPNGVIQPGVSGSLNL